MNRWKPSAADCTASAVSGVSPFSRAATTNRLSAPSDGAFCVPALSSSVRTTWNSCQQIVYPTPS